MDLRRFVKLRQKSLGAENIKQLQTKNKKLGRFFATAKTHKFSNFEDITVEHIKLRIIFGLFTTFSK